jgi:hypothetical protein
MKFMLSKFNHWPLNKELNQEASILGLRPGFVPGSKLWQDSCDFGIMVESDKTGKVFIFTLDKILGEEDVHGWEFSSYEKDCPIEKVVIFND